MLGRVLPVCVLVTAMSCAGSSLAQERECTTAALSADRPAVQRVAQDLAACLDAHRADPSSECQAQSIDLGWLSNCSTQLEASLGAREAGFNQMSMAERIEFRLDRNEFLAAKADIDLLGSLRVLTAARNIRGALPNR